jgi:hypothetical protein
MQLVPEEIRGRAVEMLKEGQRLSDIAGKNLSGEEIGKWQAQCNELIAEITGGQPSS